MLSRYSSSRRLPFGMTRHLLRNVAAGSLNKDKDVLIERREYHATAKREILPVVAGLGLLFIGRYSYRALRRMDEEWEDYEWKLQEYEKKHGVVSQDSTKLKYSDGTIGIDVGTFYITLAKDKKIIENREGQRNTFAGIVHDGDEILVGKRAFENFYQAPPSKAVMPHQDLSQLSAVLRPSLSDALDRLGLNIDNLRLVLAVPPLKWDSFTVASGLQKITVVPQPVAAVWGAQIQQVLPHDIQSPILVLDVGGDETHITVVQRNVVLTTTSLNFGGNAYVESLLDYITSDQKYTTLKNDKMATQRLYMAAHTATAELNTTPQTQIHIPYISMDLQTREPQHLDLHIARSVIDQMVSRNILKNIDTSKLSEHMPPPTSLSFLWMSVLTQLLEVTNMRPQDVSHILLVGGGTKHPMIENSIKECFQTLQGNSDNVVIPEERSDLIAVGSSSVLPTYDYDAIKGLVRVE